MDSPSEAADEEPAAASISADSTHTHTTHTHTHTHTRKNWAITASQRVTASLLDIVKL